MCHWAVTVTAWAHTALACCHPSHCHHTHHHHSAEKVLEMFFFFFFPLRSYLQNRRKQEEPFIKEQISMARHFSKQTLPPRRQQALHSCALLSVSPCASSEGTAPAHGNTETFLPTELSTPRGPWPWGNVLAGRMDTGKGDQQ